MPDHALTALRRTLEDLDADVSRALVDKVYEIEKSYLHEPDEQLRHNAIRKVVALDVEESVQTDRTPDA